MSPLPPPVRLSGEWGTAAVYPQGAHLTEWTPSGAAPVLWTSARARFEEGVAIRGGVPIVFPWFGSGRTRGMSPAHGFARLSQWRQVSSSSASDGAVCVFALDSADATDPQFDVRYSCRYEIRAGASLQLTLDVRNDDNRPFSFEEALHTYLTVGDVRRVRVVGLAGTAYLDQVAAGGPRVDVQEGEIAFTAETDRIYSSAGQVRVVDPVLGRALVIDKHHSASTVVWNPWVDKAHAMADFGDDEWPSMLCIEGGNLREAAITLAPGESHAMGYSIRVESLV